MRKFYLLLLCLQCAVCSFAQITASSYPFTSSTGVVLEDMSSGTTQLVAANTDDAASAINNIGFNFWFDGAAYSQFSVNPNGLLRLGGTVASNAFANNIGSATDAPKITAYFDDMRTGSNGKVHFKTIGTAPNRKLIVEWMNEQIPRATSGAAGAGTFQVWFFETTGVIEFVYGSGIVTNSTNGGYSTGLQSGAATNFASVTTSTPSVSYVTANNTQTNAISSGTAFVFTPPVPADPTALSITGVTVGGLTLNWTDNSSNEDGFVIYRSTDNINFSYISQVGANATSSVQTGLNGSTIYYWRVYTVSSGALSANPATGSQATGACSVTGTKTVGPAGDYPTLTAAIAAVQSGGLGGPVVLELNNAYISSSEPAFPIVIPVIPCASAVNTLTIRPGAGVTASITGSSSTSVIKFDGADWVIVDGSNNGTASRDLTIANTNSVAATAAVWLSSNGLGAGATNNTIRNLIVACGADQSTSANETFGILSSGAAIANNNDGLDNNNNTYQNNSITSARWGIFIRGGAAGINTGLHVVNNIVGPAAFGSGEIGRGGIIVQNQFGAAISGNEVRFVGGTLSTTSAGSDRTGIGAGAFDGPAPTATILSGTSITGNRVHDIVEERTFSSLGIVLASSSIPANNIVANNFVYNVRSNSTTGDQCIGIDIARGDNDKVVFNTVDLESSDIDPVGTVTSNESTIGIRIVGPTVTNLAFADNISSVDVSSNTPGLRHFAIVVSSNGYAWGTGFSNNNNYYVNTANAQMSLGGIGTTGAITPVTTLTSWKTQFTPAQDANSQNQQPLFAGATDLHLDVNFNALLDNKGIPIAGVTTDIDGDSRNGVTPDIGADEFTSLACSGAVGGTASPASVNLCGPGDPGITASGYSTGSGGTYQWESSNDNFVSNIVPVAGQNNPAILTTGTVSTNTWYRLKVTCPSGTGTAYSNVVAVTVLPISTSAIISSPNAAIPQLSEGFNSVVPSGWSVQNNSSPVGGTSWLQGNSAILFPANSGAANSYAAANSNSVANSGTISTWLISPVVNLANGDIISFYSRTVDIPTHPDRLQLRLSISGSSTDVGTLPTDIGQFTVLLTDINPTLSTTGYPSSWTKFTATIAGLSAPTTGRFAFRYFVTSGGSSGINSDYIGIDDVNYTSLGNAICAGTPSNLQLNISGGASPYSVVYSDGTTNTTLPGYVTGTNIPVSPASTTTYSIVSVTGANGCAGTGNSSPITLNVFSTPVVTSDPQSQIVCEGSGTTFDVTATALSPTYQWQVSTDGGSTFNDISGATSNSIVIPPTTVAQNGNQYRVVIGSVCGSSTSAAALLTVNTIPSHTAITVLPTPLCEGSPVNISATATGGVLSPGDAVLATSGTVNLAIPDNDPAGASSNITLPVFSITTANDLKLRLNLTHPFTGDLKVTLTSPCGTTIVFDRPGVPATAFGNGNPVNGVYTFDLSASMLFPESGPVSPGLYQPTNTSGGLNSWAGLTFPCATNGTWVLNISDNASGDAGTLVDWSVIATTSGIYLHSLTGPGTITQQPPTGTNFSTAHFSVTGLVAGNYTFNLTSTAGFGCSVTTPVNVTIGSSPAFTITPASATICAGNSQALTVNSSTGTATYVWSPATGLDVSTGTSVNATPDSTKTYSVTGTNSSGCATTVPVTITVNQLPAITVQPSPVSQTACPGTTVTYSITATGAGLTYQWRKNGTALSNSGLISGVTTNTLTITNVGIIDAANYDVVVSGTCTPAVTSNTVVLQIGTSPNILTQPTDKSVCVGGSTFFNISVAPTPPITLYHWQVSTDGGITWTNLTSPGATTATLTLSNIALSMDQNKYRVLMTTACNISLASNEVTLSVNSTPVITFGALPAQICLADTLVSLSSIASPAGGTWSGIGVSGNDFLPNHTAVGTFVLTYDYAAGGCSVSATTIAKVEDCEPRIIRLRDDAVILYPNPNDGHFFIRIHSTLYNYLGLRVYAEGGQLVKTQNYSGLVYGRVIPIDISKFPVGTYMVEFYYDDGVRTSQKTFKVVVPSH